jgi:hypothetical protein
MTFHDPAVLRWATPSFRGLRAPTAREASCASSGAAFATNRSIGSRQAGHAPASNCWTPAQGRGIRRFKGTVVIPEGACSSHALRPSTVPAAIKFASSGARPAFPTCAHGGITAQPGHWGNRRSDDLWHRAISKAARRVCGRLLNRHVEDALDPAGQSCGSALRRLLALDGTITTRTGYGRCACRGWRSPRPAKRPPTLARPPADRTGVREVTPPPALRRRLPPPPPPPPLFAATHQKRYGVGAPFCRALPFSTPPPLRDHRAQARCPPITATPGCYAFSAASRRGTIILANRRGDTVAADTPRPSPKAGTAIVRRRAGDQRAHDLIAALFQSASTRFHGSHCSRGRRDPVTRLQSR